jgi:hypothetical protein
MFSFILEPTRFHLKTNQSGFSITLEKKTFPFQLINRENSPRITENKERIEVLASN